VDSLHARLRALDDAGACGWVVDLRGNAGGNMWPMLAGVGPLLGAEVVGSFEHSPPGAAWRYREGRSWHGGTAPPREPSGWASGPAPRLAHADAPVALLIGRATASSGEMTLVAFLGRPGVRSFGDSTAGFASANAGVPLPDGATLVVTGTYPRDRLGRRYPLRLAPDERVPPPAGGAAEDPALDSALAWLQAAPACAGAR
jgi:C-terminal processing protease CtpA/Prc